MSGLFISIEGIDGAGKTTQLQRLRDYAMRFGVHPVMTREPGGTPAGLAIRELVLHGIAAFPSIATAGGSDVEDASDDLNPITETLLYVADRAQHVTQVVRPALDDDGVVISDRYIDSTLAYQAGGRGLDLETLRTLNVWASGGLMPRRTYLLDLDPEKTRSRLNEEPDRMEAAGVEFLQRTRNQFLALAMNEPKRFVVLDASLSANEIWESIRADFDALLREHYPNAAGGAESGGAEDPGR